MRALRLRAQMMPQTDAVKSAIALLEREEPAAIFSISIPAFVRWRLRLYKASLCVQLLFRSASAKRGVIEKRLDLVRELLSRRG